MPGAPLVDRTTLDLQGIMEILPHRYPFLMLDRVELRVAADRALVQAGTQVRPE